MLGFYLFIMLLVSLGVFCLGMIYERLMARRNARLDAQAADGKRKDGVHNGT